MVRLALSFYSTPAFRFLNLVHTLQETLSGAKVRETGGLTTGCIQKTETRKCEDNHIHIAMKALSVALETWEEHNNVGS